MQWDANVLLRCCFCVKSTECKVFGCKRVSKKLIISTCNSLGRLSPCESVYVVCVFVWAWQIVVLMTKMYFWGLLQVFVWTYLWTAFVSITNVHDAVMHLCHISYHIACFIQATVQGMSWTILQEGLKWLQKESLKQWISLRAKLLNSADKLFHPCLDL